MAWAMALTKDPNYFGSNLPGGGERWLDFRLILEISVEERIDSWNTSLIGNYRGEILGKRRTK